MNDKTPDQIQCEHDIAWAPDGLDGMCRKCDLYVMKPTCVQETMAWFDKNFPGIEVEA